MKLPRLILPLAMVLLASSASAAPATAPSRYFTGSDIFDLESANDPQISPDGKTIAYVRQSYDIMADKALPSIWLLNIATGQQHPLVVGTGSYSSPRWSPDGSRLAYIAAVDGANPQLFVRWIEKGESARITGLPQSPGSIVWSPDGRRIAYSMFVPGSGLRLGSAPPKPEGAKWAPPLEIIDALTYRTDGAGYSTPGYTQIFWVPSGGGKPIQLTFGTANAGGPLSWAADGRSILFSANLNGDWEKNPNEAEIYRVDIGGGAPVSLTDRIGPDNTPVVSPDGRYIAYLGNDDNGRSFMNFGLYVMNADGSNKRALSKGLDQSILNLVWSADSRSIFASYEDHAINRIARIGLDGSVRPVVAGISGGGLDRIDRPSSGQTGRGGQFSVSRNGTVAVLTGNAQRPSDIGVVNNGNIRRLTYLNEHLDTKALATPQKLAVRSSFDQRPIDAWLVTPPDFDPTKKYPLILEIHGGPWSAYGPNFSTDFQLYAAAGYIVLYANPRGSTSYGQAFIDLIDKDYPGHDYDDLMSAVDAAIATGYVDTANLFVTGASGGGILTAWIIGKTDRFRAAATQKPAINLSSLALTTDFANVFSPYWRKEKLWEDPLGYWKYSPLSLVGNVKTPTLVVVGAEDYRTPVSESEQYYTALRLRGIPTAFIKIPGVGHGGFAVRPSQSAARISAILAWFDRYRTKP